MSETDLSRAIRASLVKAGFWAIRTGVTRRRSSRGANSGEPGMPDIYLPGYGHIEVKLPGEEPSKVQLEWHEKARRLGIRVAVVESAREAVETACRWRSEIDHERAMGWRE